MLNVDDDDDNEIYLRSLALWCHSPLHEFWLVLLDNPLQVESARNIPSNPLYLKYNTSLHFETINLHIQTTFTLIQPSH